MFTYAEKNSKNIKNDSVNQFAKQANSPHQKITGLQSGRILQRKCACGGSHNHSGECEECKEKRLSLQRKPHNFLQTKLTINSPNDIYEKEADTMADKVMRMSIPENVNLKHNEEEEIQRKESSNDDDLSTAPLIVNEVINSSSGKPLDEKTRAFMEPRFGYDFSNVRIHSDSLAHQSSAEINALAYTYGNHIAFGAAQYQPSTNLGKQLLAHELTHVVQQYCGINGLQRQAIPDDIKLPCRWGDYFFEDNKLDSIRILIGMAEANRGILPPLKNISTQINLDNSVIPDDKYKVKTCIIAPTTTRFAFYKGEPILMIDPTSATVETIRHEMGHAVFNYLQKNKTTNINKTVTAENYILELTDIFLQLKAIELKNDSSEIFTANWIVDPSVWKPGASTEHPGDVDEFFGSVKEAYQTNNKALTAAFTKYGKQDKKVTVLGTRLITLLKGLFDKGKLSKGKLTSSTDDITEHLKSLSAPSKLEDTISVTMNLLTDKLLDPDKRKNCKPYQEK